MHELLHDEGFWTALVVALAGSILVMVLHRRVWFARFGFEAGAVAALAALVSFVITDREDMLSFVGLVALAFGVIMVRDMPARWSMVAAVPGAGVIAVVLGAPVPDWASVTCFLGIILVVPCAIEIDTGAPRLVPLLLATTAIGMWGTTPDTEHTRVLVGALLGAAVLAFDTRLRRGAGGTAVLIGIMVWAAIVDGYPRDGAVVGALACFGVVVLLPILRRARVPFTVLPVVVVLVVQTVVVVIASRVAGLETDAAPALLISAAAWAAAAVALRVAIRRTH
jgi:hypothetical protein